MSVTDVLDITDPQVKAAIDENGIKTTTRLYKVFTDDKYDGAFTVMADSRVPKRGNGYDFGNDADANLKVNGVRPERFEDFFTWLVYVDYSTAATSDNPTGDPPKIVFRSRKYTKPAIISRNGNAILNSAGFLFDPPPDKPESHMVVEINFASADLDPFDAEAYIDSVNSDVWFGKDPNTWYMEDITAEPQNFGGLDYYQFTLIAEYDKNTWTKKILDRGFMEKVGGNVRQILDARGQPVSEPQLLDGNGVKLAPGNPAFFRDFDILDELPFNALFPSP